MTFREALQHEIDTQGLSVAQVAKDSNLSKGAIYNILNGTTEDARIRPATRKAIAEACGRELRADGEGVVFEYPGAVLPASPTRTEVGDVVLSWMRDRLFLKDRHASAAFDWIHRMEESGKLEGPRIVDRVYQNRPDFVSMMVHNKGPQPVERVSADVSVVVTAAGETTYSVSVPGPIGPGESSEFTVFAGVPCTLRVDRAECSDVAGRSFEPVVPERLEIVGGLDD